ncbi:hypothetical protein JG688_00016337 [Phytophthora aleatoria]|uniref:Uncharacterized protein n=1 Tax=Phytophthora aleatoria TaxID=2496075 RepID=A0A8J5IYF5_9STRA|nr:hypothetical protein JG688_00016337 [Phytophthora aleatoria]
MGVSDVGLCALCPSRREYIQVRYDQDQIVIFREHGEGEYGINLRDLMSAVFACAIWGQHWTSTDPFCQIHVQLWIDNQSAVAWNNKRSSRNNTAQLLLRLLSLMENHFNFFTAAAHIPGASNIMADAGLRVWQSTDKAAEFANLSFGWTQVQVPNAYRKFSPLWEQCCVLGH